MTDKDDKILMESIKRAVRESIFDIVNGADMYEKKSESEKEKKSKDSEDKKNIKATKLRKRVIRALKNEKVDVAQYAYALWPEKEEDSARSYFYKCLDGKLNDDGDPYSFSDEEIIRLHGLLTDNTTF